MRLLSLHFGCQEKLCKKTTFCTKGSLHQVKVSSRKRLSNRWKNRNWSNAATALLPISQCCLFAWNNSYHTVSKEFNFSKKYSLTPKLQSKELFYEAKMSTSDGYSAIQKCSQTIEHLRHKNHTSELSNEVYNFVLPVGAKKLSAKVEIYSVFYLENLHILTTIAGNFLAP